MMDLIFCKIPIDIIEIVVKYTDCDTYYLLRDFNFTFSNKLHSKSIESRVLYILKEKRIYGHNYVYRYVIRLNDSTMEHNEYDKPYCIDSVNNMYWRKLGKRYRLNDYPDGVTYTGNREWYDSVFDGPSTRHSKHDLPKHISILTGYCFWKEGKRNPIQSRTNIK